MDVAAGIVAGRHCGGQAVTVAVDDLHFARPIRLGDVVIVRAQVNHTGSSSMEIGVEVEREVLGSRTREHCLTGFFLFVAVDRDGHPIPVPPLEPQTDEEKHRFRNAVRRRESRLARRRAERADR
jgi:acyl-CoA hydrolase